MAAYPVLCVPRTCTSFVIFFLGYWQWKNSPTAFGKQSKSSNSTALSKISTQSSTIWSNHRCLSSHHLENSRERERENSRLESHSGSCIRRDHLRRRKRQSRRRPESSRVAAMRPPTPLPFLLLLLLLLVLLLPSPPAAAAGGADGWEAIGAAAAGGGRRRVASPGEQEAAAAGLLRRLLPSHARSFRFQIVSKVGARDDFWLGGGETVAAKITVAARLDQDGVVADGFDFDSLIQGGVCGGSSCFRISNADGSRRNGAEILYASTALLCVCVCLLPSFFYLEQNSILLPRFKFRIVKIMELWSQNWLCLNRSGFVEPSTKSDAIAQ